MDKEYILCASIDFDGLIISAYRHGDCYNILKSLKPNLTFNEIPDRTKQGFLTSKNRYVDRKEAWIIAKENNQIKYGLVASEKGEESILISENLY